MTPRFFGKVALVTGGASGIGKAFAVRLAAEGARVVVLDVRGEPAAEVAREIQNSAGEAAGIEADVVSREGCERAVRSAVERWGGLDILVNSAGIGAGAPVAELGEETWDAVLDVNLKGVFLMCRAAFPALVERGGGAVVNIASLAGLVATPGMGAYGASKAGVIQFTRVLALEGARHQVRANAVCPVWTDTPMLQQHLEQSGRAERVRRGMLATVPLGRLVTAEEVAAAGLFLASDEARFITGVALPVDGGALCR